MYLFKKINGKTIMTYYLQELKAYKKKTTNETLTFHYNFFYSEFSYPLICSLPSFINALSVKLLLYSIDQTSVFRRSIFKSH